ncbi:DUF5689 domain-containing protein [Aquimarina sp. 2201CG14-23]|uniref:DUF5689 domain-containing protein n=1 Tax=Aquimarina mycalae TaxID=3040073 RepID=UPI0024782D44|nr:DUF5689 domain-containing protein [Aquimarina sp. 2201CG14-23]MDH7446294.1 DUF5689 domain-containing protein [Aquimarina sp. 2201CG14-23]
MNTINLKKLISVLVLAVTFTACVQDDDFKTPPLSIDEPNIDGTVIGVDAVLGILAQEIADEGADAKVTFEDTNNYVEGYIVSNDKAGNFFEEFVMQDAAENPSGGLRVLIDVNPLFTTYEFGRKVFIKLDGLSVGIENGVTTLGVLSGDEVDQIPSFSQNDFIKRSAEVATIVPLEITFADFSDDITNVYVKINNVQFNKSDVLGDNPLTFSAEATDEFDGERNLESCDDGGIAVLSTSTFADFKGLTLPSQQGSFEGILTKNFFGDTFNLVLNDPTGLTFDNETRCDPNVLECTGNSGGSTVIFEEDFTGLSINDLENAGWLNVNTTGGSLDYFVGSFSGNQYAQISGFNSGENPFEVWLVTPEIDLTASIEEELSFDIQANFDNGNILTAFITDNFTGDVTTTEWTQLDASIPNGNPNGFGSFEAVGPVNISCIEGNVRIAFRYAGADPGPTTRYHIDNIEISGN